MSETKTVEQWLMELPEPYRSQALENMDADGDGEEWTITSALSAAFVWAGSPQGHKYWEDLHVKLGGERSIVLDEGTRIAPTPSDPPSPWIKVSDTPEVESDDDRYDFHKTSRYVLVWSSMDLHPSIGRYSHKFKEWYGLEMEVLWGITHWMPLPDPPKED